MSTRKIFMVIFSLFMFLSLAHVAKAQYRSVLIEENELKEVNNQIRREKFDMVLPEVMRKNNVDMWIHVMRERIPDAFGAEALGSTSGLFVFTDRGGDRIERAVIGRRWGESQTETWGVHWDTKLVEECGAYDIVHDPVLVLQPPGSPLTEYDHRFKGLKEFVEARDPKCIAVNYLLDFGPYPTKTRGIEHEGISHTDYHLLTKELGNKYTSRLVSSERVMMDYIIRKVPSEIKLLKRIRKLEDERIDKAFAEIVPGETKERDVGLNVFRRRSPGVSQRGRTSGYENAVIQGGDIVAAPSQGRWGYVLREGETEPPPEIKKLWTTYRKIDKILAENIKAGLTGREIVKNCNKEFDKEGVIVRDTQLQLWKPKKNFACYTEGYDPEKTHLAYDCHGMKKGAYKWKSENYFGPRIGSNGPEWMWDIPLPPNHHHVMEYFFYMPSPTDNKDESQYLFWWDHEQVIATERGVEYFTPPQKELYLIH